MRLIVIITTLVLSFNLFAQNPPEKYQKLWMQVNEGDNSAAIKELRRIAKKEKNDPWPYWMLGIAMNMGPHSEEEQKCYLKSIEIDSTFGPAHYSYAIGLDQTDSTKFSEIEYHFNKAIALVTPEDNFYYAPRAEFYYARKRYDEAISDAKKHVQLNPSNCYFAHQIIVKSLYDQGKKEELKKFLKTYNPQNEAGPEDPDYYYFLGTVYEEFGDKMKACLSYIQAVNDQEFYREMFSGEEGFKDPDWYETALKKLEECQ